jgi:6-phosphogluconate dehydrogenase
MINAALPNQFEIGIVGLDASGRRLARAMARHRLNVAAYDSNAENIKALHEESPGISIHIAPGMAEFMHSLRQFRIVVVSGSETAGDSFSDLLRQLESGDLLIDAGNCHFKDCSRRANNLAERGIRYLGIGIIGGGQDGCCGPVLLAGGRPEIYHSVLSLLESMAFNEDGEPYVSHLGPDAAGHFVKMVHDGIEYGLGRLVLETFDLLKRTLVLTEDELRDVAAAWEMGALHGCLRDEAARWTSQAARELDAQTPTIDAAVGLRTLSELEKQNDFATTAFRQPLGHFGDDAESILDELRGALHAAIIITYAEGMSLLAKGSERYGFDLDLVEVIRLWKGCHSRRAALLDEIALAIRSTPHLPNLLDDADLSEKVMEYQERLRHAVWRAALLQTTVPALMASLDYLDSYRGAWLPVNLIQVPATSRSSPAYFPERVAVGNDE